MKLHVSRLMFTSLLTAVTACGGSSPSSPEDGRSAGTGDQAAGLTEIVEPTAEYYESVMAEAIDATFGPRKTLVVPNAPINVFVNFGGARVTKGYGLGQAFVVCGNEAVIPPADMSAEELDEISTYVTTYFAAIDQRIQISLQRPAAQIFSVVHVGGKPSDAGCNDASLKMRAPFDRDNMNPADVGFVFKDATTDLNQLVTAIQDAIEAMLGISGSAALSIPADIVSEDQLPGIQEIHGISRLLWEVDETKVLNISSLQDELDELIPGGARYLDGLDRVMTVVAGVGSSQDGSSGNNGNGNGGRLGGLLGNLFGGKGGNTGGGPVGSAAPDIIAAIGALSGNPGIAAAGQMLGGLSGGGGAGGGKSEAGTEKRSRLPDYASIIGVSGFSSLGELLAHMRGHAAFVAKNYDEKTVKALSAMLIVAYSQGFRASMGE